MARFLYGAATASYQIEGAVKQDGRGASVWDRFSHTPGTIKTGENGDRACDHYRQLNGDLDLMSSLGLDAYRFSVSWSRILPEGTGRVEEKGLDFYDRLVDGLCQRGISPFLTLFHWDLPQALQDEFGGFSSRRAVDAYLRYVELVSRRLGDRVKHWITFNEPWVYAVLGHYFGVHAPGKRSFSTMMRVAHHQLLAHGKAVDLLHSTLPDAKVGITLNLAPVDPRSESGADRKAADLGDQFLNRFFLDPLFRASYPVDFWKRARLFRPKIEAGDMEAISRPMDFIGVNNYTREHAFRVCRPFFPFSMTGLDIPEQEYEKDGKEYTAMGWEVYPRGLYRVLCRLRDDYGNIPSYVTENGAAFTDVPASDGVHDPKRMEFLKSYTAAALKAREEGCQLQGYFVWSLMDNFEWAEGYSKRFGIVYVDYESGQRIVKDSGRWYANFIREQKGRA